jgi:hypothetical protein
MDNGKVGAPFQYSDSYVQFLASLKIGFKIPVIFPPLLQSIHMYCFSKPGLILKCTCIQSSRYYSNILLVGKSQVASLVG